MNRLVLERAQRYEQEYEKSIDPMERPAFHMSARVGWINDPNGFSYYQGKVHLFYQYHPYDAHWGPMHWGHATTTDLLHWKYEPTVLAPDQPYDQDGCFSGSAITLEDGRQLLIYTGIVRTEQGVLQTQNGAIGDGHTYQKLIENPLIDRHQLPNNASPYAFRDPKIWKEKDTYYLIVANQNEKGSGQILKYESGDGLQWNYTGKLLENTYAIGDMWECPDYFILDGQEVYIGSAMHADGSDLEYPEGFVSFYMTGFPEETHRSVDHGLDFYAPQTLAMPDGRRILIAWMQDWKTSRLHSKEWTWFGQMTIPRELSLKDGALIQWPVKEVERLREASISFGKVIRNLPVCSDMELEITNTSWYVLTWESEDISVSLRYDGGWTMIRTDIFGQHRRTSCLYGNPYCLRILSDRKSLEIFVDHGKQAFTTTWYGCSLFRTLTITGQDMMDVKGNLFPLKEKA